MVSYVSNKDMDETAYHLSGPEPAGEPTQCKVQKPPWHRPKVCDELCVKSSLIFIAIQVILPTSEIKTSWLWDCLECLFLYDMVHNNCYNVPGELLPPTYTLCTILTYKSHPDSRSSILVPPPTRKRLNDMPIKCFMYRLDFMRLNKPVCTVKFVKDNAFVELFSSLFFGW